MNETKELKKVISDEELKRAINTPRLVKMIIEMTVAEQDELLKYLTEKNLAKKRKYPRKNVKIEIDYMARDKLYHDIVQSVSANGLFIETREKFNIGEDVILILSLPNHDRPIRLAGEVVRIANDGIGIQFKQLTTYLEDIIKELVEKI